MSPETRLTSHLPTLPTHSANLSCLLIKPWFLEHSKVPVAFNAEKPLAEFQRSLRYLAVCRGKEEEGIQLGHPLSLHQAWTNFSCCDYMVPIKFTFENHTIKLQNEILQS